MNRRIRNSDGSKSKSDKFLKPGALALIRDSKIRSPPRCAAKKIILLSSPPPQSPVRTIAQIDGSPCFAGRSYGPRLLKRKKLVATKRCFFASANPDPLLSELGLDAFGGGDLLLAH